MLITLGSIFNFSLIDSSSGFQYDSKAFLFSLVNKPGWAPVKLPQTGKYSSSRNSRSRLSSILNGPTFGGVRGFCDLEMEGVSFTPTPKELARMGKTIACNICSVFHDFVK